MSHILEVVISAFIVGVAGSLATFTLEKRAHEWVAQGKSARLWGAVGILLILATIVVVAGFYADSLTFHFIHRTISISVPNPHIARATRVPAFRLLAFAAAFLLVVLGDELSRLLAQAEQQMYVLAEWLKSFSGTVRTVSNGVTIALAFQYFHVSLYTTGPTREAGFIAGLALFNLVFSRVVSSRAAQISRARVFAMVSILWLGLTYSILTIAFMT